MLLNEQVTQDSDGLIALTVDQPLPSSDGAPGIYPVELRLEPTEFRGLDQH